MKTAMNAEFHQPILLNEVITGLRIIPNYWYIDATAGGGGHLGKILEKGGKVLAIDQDMEAVDFLKQRFKRYLDIKSLIIVRENFSHLIKIFEKVNIGRVEGILFDLGTSKFQIFNSGKGFSFKKDEFLDMRMSNDSAVTAEHLINNLNYHELLQIFRKYGEEILAEPIVQAVFRARPIKRIRTTGDLAEIILNVYKSFHRKSLIHPATKVFQALRIAVNNEIEILKNTLSGAVSCLANGGRILVISYHSLEDRIVKQVFNDLRKRQEIGLITKKPIRASFLEIRANPAARSAKLRIAERKYIHRTD